MAERRATNKYYPPDYNPSKHGSINSYHNSHPLRERAKKLKSHGILVVRFELPFAILCNTCNGNMARGVRFNADKEPVGNYFSTKIFQFSMRCIHCGKPFFIRTDPKASEYTCYSGCTRRNDATNADNITNINAEDLERSLAEEDNVEGSTIEHLSPEERERLKKNPIARLEHVQTDKLKAATKAAHFQRQYHHYQDLHEDEFSVNQAARKRLRVERNKQRAEVEEGKRIGVALPVSLENNLHELREISALQFKQQSNYLDNVKRKINQRANSSIFNDRKAASKKKKSDPKAKDLIVIEETEVDNSDSDVILDERNHNKCIQGPVNNNNYDNTNRAFAESSALCSVAEAYKSD
jgi:coiled-coil domain-containing protein 130